MQKKRRASAARAARLPTTPPITALCVLECDAEFEVWDAMGTADLDSVPDADTVVVAVAVAD
jgi:hypothetical protein